MVNYFGLYADAVREGLAEIHLINIRCILTSSDMIYS